MSLIFFVLLLFCNNLFAADNIYFYGGCELNNVYILSKTDSLLTIKTSDERIITFKNPNIRNIEKKEVSQNLESVLSGCNWIDPIQNTWDNQPETTYKSDYINLNLLPLAFISGLLCYEHFADANDISDLIIESRKLDPNVNVSKLQSQESRKEIIGYGLAIATIGITLMAILPVKTIVTNDKVTLSINL